MILILLGTAFFLLFSFAYCRGVSLLPRSCSPSAARALRSAPPPADDDLHLWRSLVRPPVLSWIDGAIVLTRANVARSDLDIASVMTALSLAIARASVRFRAARIVVLTSLSSEWSTFSISHPSESRVELGSAPRTPRLQTQDERAGVQGPRTHARIRVGCRDRFRADRRPPEPATVRGARVCSVFRNRL